jgi:hypothetical protein
VFLTSVFTHMPPGELEHYLSEIARVSRPGARCLMTFFLLNEESTKLIDAKQGIYNFEAFGPGYRAMNPERPEDAIAYPEEYVRRVCASHGLPVQDPVRYGKWCGRETFVSFQDMVIVERAGPRA